MTPSDDRARKRDAYLPPEAGDFVVAIGGREVRWLSRLVGWIAAPVMRWRRRPGRRR